MPSASVTSPTSSEIWRRMTNILMIDYGVSYVFYIVILVVGLKIFKDIINPK